MTYSATQSGFTDKSGTVANIVDGSTSTGWTYENLADVDSASIIIDTGGWFDGSTLNYVANRAKGFPYNVPNYGAAPDKPLPFFAVQLSADGTNWYNLNVNGGAFIFGAVGISDTPNQGNLTGSYWFSYSAVPWPRAEYFRYIRLIGTGAGVFNQYQGDFVLVDVGFFQDSGSTTPISVDTSGGANPNPPTGTPDTTPLPPADSSTPAQVAGAFARVLRQDVSTAKIASVGARVLRQDVSTANVAFIGARVLRRVVRTGQRAFGVIIG